MRAVVVACIQVTSSTLPTIIYFAPRTQAAKEADARAKQTARLQVAALEDRCTELARDREQAIQVRPACDLHGLAGCLLHSGDDV